MHHFRQSIGRCTVARPLIHKHHRAPSVSPLPRCPVTCSKRGCSSTGTNKAKRGEKDRKRERVERLGKKGKGGTKTSKGKREKGRETTAAPGTAIFTLRHSWSTVGCCCCCCYLHSFAQIRGPFLDFSDE